MRPEIDLTDKKIICKKCFAELGEQRLQGQILIIGQAAIFNFAAIACLNCEKINIWKAGNLRYSNMENVDALEDLPQPDKAIVKELGIKKPNNKNKNHKTDEHQSKKSATSTATTTV